MLKHTARALVALLLLSSSPALAALGTPTLKTWDASVSASPWTTASFSVTAGDLLLFNVLCFPPSGTPPLDPTATWNGQAFTQIATDPDPNTGGARSTLFGLVASATATATAVITKNASGTAPSGCEWQAVTISGAQATVGAAVPQSGVLFNSSGAGANIAATLPGGAAATSTIIAFWISGGSITATVDTGWTGLGSTNHPAATGDTVFAEYKAGNSDISSNYVAQGYDFGIVVEVAVLAAGGTFPAAILIRNHPVL